MLHQYHNIKKLSIFLILMINLITTAWADTLTSTSDNNTQNFLGGIFRGQFTNSLSTDAAASLGVEAGPRNYRVDGTVGFNLSNCQRLKLTGEYLRQDIDYSFATGVAREWMQQGAGGLDYQQHLTANGLNYIDLIGYYSHAPSKTLDPVTGNYLTNDSDLISYTNLRRIAGSNAYGFSPTVTLNPWCGGQASLALNYDNVHYDNHCGPEQQSDGFGGTVTLNQQLGPNIQFNASAGIRAPFNAYQAGIRYALPHRNLSVGIIGSYTDGRDNLPNTSLAGIEVTYIADKTNSTRNQFNNRPASIAAWTQQPAVYMPQVLAIAENCLSLTTLAPCVPPAFSGTIESQTITGGSFVSIPTALFFSGTNLGFSAVNLPPDLTINPSTGLISGIMGTASSGINIVVTATNGCGSAQSNAFNLDLD